MKVADVIMLICAGSLGTVMVMTCVVALVGLFDSRVDNMEIFQMLTPAFNTIVGGMVGVIAGIHIGKKDGG